MIASMYGHDEVVQLLCQRLPLNDVDLGGNTAVHYAARYGEEAVLKHLVGVGADCTVQNYGGETPEQLAREAGFDNCVVMLQVSPELLYSLLISTFCFPSLTRIAIIVPERLRCQADSVNSGCGPAGLPDVLPAVGGRGHG